MAALDYAGQIDERVFFHDDPLTREVAYVGPFRERYYTEGPEMVLGTPVTTYVKSVASNTVMYPSDLEEMPGWQGTANLEQFPKYFHYQGFFDQIRERGIDPIALMRDRALELGYEFLVSMRMNDGHFANDIDPRENPFTSRFWIEHQDLLNQPGTAWPDDAWKFLLDWNHEPVRDYLLSLMHEQIDRYGVHGYEFDWSRGVPYVDPLTGPVEPITDMVRSVREHLGPDRLLVHRVGPDIDALYARGLDIRAWVEQGLAEYFVVCCLYDADLSAWTRLLQDTEIKFHVSPDPRKGRGAGSWTPEIYRAAASNYYRQGAAGLYHFNTWVRHTSHYVLFRDVSHPACCRYRDKTYMATEDNWREHTDTIPVPLSDPDRPARVALEVSDDLAAHQADSTLNRATLCLVLGHWHPEDQIQVYLNGELLDGTRARVDQPTQRSGSIRWQATTSPWIYQRRVLGYAFPLYWNLDLVDHLPVVGENLVEVRRLGEHESSLLLVNVDLEVLYDFCGKDGPAHVAGREEVGA